ncbi:MAG: hypothetical protein PVJ06_11325 [Desulfobacterales bacterium]|jgi:hypothetical protein
MNDFLEGMSEAQDEHSMDEKAQQLPGVYEIYGLFVEDRVIRDMVIEAVGLSQLVLIVDSITKGESAGESKSHVKNSEKGYSELTWDMIDGNVMGTYGIQEPLMPFVDKKIRIRGIIYDLCGNGFYLCRKTDSEVYCSSDPVNYLELRDKDGNRLSLNTYQRYIK